MKFISLCSAVVKVVAVSKRRRRFTRHLLFWTELCGRDVKKCRSFIFVLELTKPAAGLRAAVGSNSQSFVTYKTGKICADISGGSEFSSLRSCPRFVAIKLQGGKGPRLAGYPRLAGARPAERSDGCRCGCGLPLDIRRLFPSLVRAE
jgi:hypothetical protein